jgi:hypothetical protein
MKTLTRTSSVTHLHLKPQHHCAHCAKPLAKETASVTLMLQGKRKEFCIPCGREKMALNETSQSLGG